MGAYGSPELYPYENKSNNENRNKQYYNTPRIRDYLAWMLIPACVGIITCGIGTIILMVVWACDKSNMARANYFRAIFIIAIIGILIYIFLLAIMIALISG